MKKFLAVVLVLVIGLVCLYFNGVFYSTIQNVTGIGDKVVSTLSSTIISTVSSVKDSVQNSLGIFNSEKNENVATMQEEKSDSRIRIALDEYIGWAPLLTANGGLVTTPDSLNGQTGLNVEYVLTNDSLNSSRALIEEYSDAPMEKEATSIAVEKGKEVHDSMEEEKSVFLLPNYWFLLSFMWVSILIFQLLIQKI